MKISASSQSRDGVARNFFLRSEFPRSAIWIAHLGKGRSVSEAASFIGTCAQQIYMETIRLRKMADFNGDGIPDLVVASGGDNWVQGTAVAVLLGKGDGSFQLPLTYVAGGGPNSVAVGDFNGDGCPDLAVANRTSLSVLLNAAD
jgi:hypothetical protein